MIQHKLMAGMGVWLCVHLARPKLRLSICRCVCPAACLSVSLPVMKIICGLHVQRVIPNFRLERQSEFE